MAAPGITPVSQAPLPADIAKAPKKDQETYRTAMGFEQLMINEMLKNVPTLSGESAMGGSSDDVGGDSSSQAPAAYQQMLPTALADSLTAQGGLGLARNFYDSLKANQ